MLTRFCRSRQVLRWFNPCFCHSGVALADGSVIRRATVQEVADSIPVSAIVEFLKLMAKLAGLPKVMNVYSTGVSVVGRCSLI